MKLTYFNHASIAIEDTHTSYAIITDPWVNSKAFGGWKQHPRPNQGAIEAFLEKLDKYAILISHGHDDHCDDKFIMNKLNPCQIFIPKFRSPGFRKRIQSLCSNDTVITELEDGKIYTGHCFRLLATINPFFTNNDSVIAVQDDKDTIIHANDNWHIQPDDILRLLKNFSLGTDVTYLAQIGIAGSFPIFYLGINIIDKKNLITSELRTQAECIEANSRSLDAKRAFSYANESRFTYLDSSALYSTNLRENVLGKCVNDTTIYRGELANIRDFFEGSLHFCNLRNHSTYYHHANTYCKLITSLEEWQPPIVTSDHLKPLQDKINTYIYDENINGQVILASISIHDLRHIFSKGDISIDVQECPTLYLFSTPYVWNKILLGVLNLESITIGGCGLLKKVPTTWNARFVHHALSRFAYRFQANAKQTHLT